MHGLHDHFHWGDLWRPGGVLVLRRIESLRQAFWVLLQTLLTVFATVQENIHLSRVTFCREQCVGFSFDADECVQHSSS